MSLFARNTLKCASRHTRRLVSTNVFQTEPRKGDRVIIGMSGGVDSSVTAKLLADQDYDLSAVFMRNWDTRDESGTDQGCQWEKDWEDVQRVCRALDVPCKMVDFSQQYWTRIFEPALHDWESGLTPNPDVWCNREIKFGALLDPLLSGSAIPSDSWFATGHYARKTWAPATSVSPPRPKLLRAVDPIKDQSYYLSSISEAALARSLFPIGHLTKAEVRELAKQAKLPTAERQESMGLCFIGERGRFNKFISGYLPPKPGPMIDLDTGEQVATHKGLWNYTIGENARVSGRREKLYVAQKLVETNEIFVVQGSVHPALFRSTAFVINWRWIWEDAPPAAVDTPEGLRADVKIRHVMRADPCTARRRGKELKLTFDAPQKGVAPGQVATLWDGDWCLGCGIIKNRALPLRADQRDTRLAPARKLHSLKW